MVYVDLYGSWLEIVAVQLDLFVYVNRISLLYPLLYVYGCIYLYGKLYTDLQAASTEEILNCDPGLHW